MIISFTVINIKHSFQHTASIVSQQGGGGQEGDIMTGFKCLEILDAAILSYQTK